MRNLSRAMFNDGSGRLGQVSNASGSLTEIVLATGLGPVGNEVADATKVKIADFKEANFEERDLIQVVNGSASATASLRSSDKLEIEQVLVDSGHIILKGTSLNIQALDDLVMQESLNNDPTGMKGVLDKTPGAGVTNYGIKVGRRWQAVQKTHSQDISTDVLNEVMLKIKKACGKSPNLIVCSYKQYEKILKILEDKVQFKVEARAQIQTVNGALSFSGIQFMSIDGPVGIFPERFVEDDRIYLLNDAHIHIHHRPDFGWFDDDGTVFLRKATSDAYEARYGGYLEVYINPCFHGVITGLPSA